MARLHRVGDRVEREEARGGGEVRRAREAVARREPAQRLRREVEQLARVGHVRHNLARAARGVSD